MGTVTELPRCRQARARRTVRAKSRLLTAGVVALLAAGTIGALPAAGANPAAPGWTVKSVPAVANFAFKSVSCTGTHCVALANKCGVGGCGGLLPAKAFYSTNKGATWTPAVIPASVGNALAVSCGSPEVCVAVATKGPLGPARTSAIIETRNGGKSWSVTDEAKYMLSVAACASATDCFALGSLSTGYLTTVSLFSTNGGKTWGVGGFPANLYYVEAAACSSATTCSAVGEAKNYIDGVTLSSTNAGRTWKDVPAPGNVSAIGDDNCDGLTCIGVAGAESAYAVISKNGGKSWTAHALPTGRTFQGASCLSATQCIVVGYLTDSTPEMPGIDISGNSGATWAPQALPHEDGALSGAACLTGVCVAVGIRVVYAGKTPTAEYPLALGY
jgi:hypothetical protein